MDIEHLVPLDDQSLVDSAKRMTGLSDFGDNDWVEPFQVFVDSLDREANLNLVGRLRARSHILHLLSGRLQIEQAYKQYPEIVEEKITEPIIVVGQGRSGTSFLVNLLAAIPENGFLSNWEAIFPCPPPKKETYQNDARIPKAEALISQINRVVPSMESMHEFSAWLPVEDVLIESFCFRGPSWMGTLGQVPSYDAYMATQDPIISIRYHERVLKLLQWKNPRRRWAIKDVLFLDKMEQLLQVYPDACFVWPHRDPVKALASTISLIGTFQWSSSDTPFIAGSYEFATDLGQAASRINRVIDKLEAGMVPDQQMFHLHYSDLIENPLGVIAGMYAHFGFELSAESNLAVQNYINDNPRDSRPPHKFSLGSAQDVVNARAHFKRYQEHFAVPSE
ncbi:MAG: sulfotransferase [Lacipirellulaceae bacterium]|uniref:sulfotransferase family protein n=1 Tax=Marinobacter salarius TaxID=1420917 RepID=UPI0032EE91E8